jgi:uncharacterized membrane protein YgdD (TMEM256/DUF423 family)
MQHTNGRFWIQLAAIMGLLAVAIGAFGAHGLKPKLTELQIQTFNTGVQYHFYHTIAILATGLLALIRPSKWLQGAGWLFFAGILCFSGSLYLLSTRDLLSFPVGWAGPITPLGGVCFMIGWGLIWYSAQQNRT